MLLCPRRLVKKNGVIYPSLALAAMGPADRDRFLLLHAGEGGEREEIERIVRENHLEKNVRLLGGQGPDAILELYRLADIVLVPSVHSENVEEATSLSALEAMASGRPLIAGDVGGLAEMVVDGETGLLVPADAEALAAAILRLAAAPELGARMAARRPRLRGREPLAPAGRGRLRGSLPRGRRPRDVAGGRRRLPRDRRRRRRRRPPCGRPAGRPRGRGLAVALGAGFPLDVVTLEQAAQWVIAAAAERAGDRPAGTHAHAPSRSIPNWSMRAQHDPAAAEALLNADLCYPDGVGAVWAAGRQGARPRGRPGAAGGHRRRRRRGRARPSGSPASTWPQRVLELAAERGLPVYFLGAADGVAEEAARRQVERLPGSAHRRDPPRLLLLRPRRTKWCRPSGSPGPGSSWWPWARPGRRCCSSVTATELGAAVGLGVGGSFDVWAGTVKRAPAWTQRAKVEWLYRLAADPRRLRRQLGPSSVRRAGGALVSRRLRTAAPGAGAARARSARVPDGDARTGGPARRRTGRRRLRYLISGYYGEKNAGDEAILAGILQEIGRRDSGGPLHRALLRSRGHRAPARRPGATWRPSPPACAPRPACGPP